MDYLFKKTCNMVRHIFLDKTNTIIKGSDSNVGLNPVAELNYGDAVTRFLVHFDVDTIKALVDEKEIVDLDKAVFTLKMTNCAPISGQPYDKKLQYGGTCGTKERASSFNVLCLSLPQEFDGGRGFEFMNEPWTNSNKSFTTSGSNWYQSANGYAWPAGKEGGVYTLETIVDEYNKWAEGEDSLVVNRQHFDFGDEDLAIDITKYVVAVLNGDAENYGLMLMFTPRLEQTTTDAQQYVGFFTDHTNTFFHPFVEVSYENAVFDDRASFYEGKENKLFFYASISGDYVNLDEIPTCTINDDVQVPVYQLRKGVYYALVDAETSHFGVDTINFDVWSNLKLGGQTLPNVEMEFVSLSSKGYLNLGGLPKKDKRLVPTLYGINDNEGLTRHEVRRVDVDFRVEYETNKKRLCDNAFYRLYTMDGVREIEILNGYQPIEMGTLQNYFLIHTEDLIPGKYYVDVKAYQGVEQLYFKDALHFKVIDDVTERFS